MQVRYVTNIRLGIHTTRATEGHYPTYSHYASFRYVTASWMVKSTSLTTNRVTSIVGEETYWCTRFISTHKKTSSLFTGVFVSISVWSAVNPQGVVTSRFSGRIEETPRYVITRSLTPYAKSCLASFLGSTTVCVKKIDSSCYKQFT